MQKGSQSQLLGTASTNSLSS